MAEKKVLLCLGKRKRAVSFTKTPSETDKSALTKKIREEFSDILDEDSADIIIQVKDEGWNQWVDLKDEGSVQDQSVLQIITETGKVFYKALVFL